MNKPEERCWLCDGEPVYHDVLGLGWCQKHYEWGYETASWVEAPDAPSD